jgi:hypothetical protein
MQIVKAEFPPGEPPIAASSKDAPQGRTRALRSEVFAHTELAKLPFRTDRDRAVNFPPSSSNGTKLAEINRRQRYLVPVTGHRSD